MKITLDVQVLGYEDILEVAQEIIKKLNDVTLPDRKEPRTIEVVSVSSE